MSDPETIKDAGLRVMEKVMGELFADLLPPGFWIYKICEYDPEVFPAPGLSLEKRANPAARYVAILTSDTASVPALGETVTDAISAAIAKIEAACRAAVTKDLTKRGEPR